MGLARLQGYNDLAVEVGKGTIRIQDTGIQDDLGSLLDFGFLCVGGDGSGEVVVDHILGVAIPHFQPSTYCPHNGPPSRFLQDTTQSRIFPEQMIKIRQSKNADAGVSTR